MAPNNNIDPGGPGPFNLIFANQFKWVPNNNIDPWATGPFSLVFANQFKNFPYNNIYMAPNLNGPSTIIFIQGAQNPQSNVCLPILTYNPSEIKGFYPKSC